MNWTIYGMECVGTLILFTCLIMIPLCRNPVWWIHDYPKDIQEKYFETHDRIPTQVLSTPVFLKKAFAVLLAIGYVMMAAGFHCESEGEHRIAATAGMAFAVIYAVLILLVYFAQTTTVRLDTLTDPALSLLDYSRGGLMFHYDLLGYGMMALSTFFLGLTVRGRTPVDQWLKRLMMIHGIFFFGCFIMPMTGVFRSMADGESSMGGVIALEFWCAYFIPVGILAFAHFRSYRSIGFHRKGEKDAF